MSVASPTPITVVLGVLRQHMGLPGSPQTLLVVEWFLPLVVG